MKYSAKIFSRIGELMQGILPDRSSFLISGLPSCAFFSEAILEDDPDFSFGLPPKAQKAVDLFYTISGVAGTAHPKLLLRSNIPPGKGLSSSSADILSVLYVLNDYWSTGFSPAQLYSIAARIEPTDPCLSADIVVFRQQTGIIEQVLSLPPLAMIYFDAAPDRRINTLELQRTYDKDAPGFFHLLRSGFLHSAAKADYAGLFDCTTRSALYNQSIISLPRIGEYHQLAVREHAGLMVAHSGTIIGLLTRPGEAAALLPLVKALANRYQPTIVHIEEYFSPGIVRA
jgi:L-threonine kinase